MKKLLYIPFLFIPLVAESTECRDNKICHIIDPHDCVNVRNHAAAYGTDVPYCAVEKASGAVSLGFGGGCESTQITQGSFCVVANPTCKIFFINAGPLPALVTLECDYYDDIKTYLAEGASCFLWDPEGEPLLVCKAVDASKT